MMRHILAALLLIIISLPALAEDNVNYLYQEANKLYQQGKFRQAAESYENLISKGYASSDVYYNLGNAYFRMNNIPGSILNFERAKRLAPGDDDIDFNLKIANLKTVDKIESVPRLFFVEWYYSLRSSISSCKWAVVIIIFSWLTFITLALFMLLYTPLMKKTLFAAAAGFFLLTVISAIIASGAYSAEQSRSAAIIMSPSVYVKSSPDSQSTDLFILHEGTKVNILDSVGGWDKIRLANGTEGWLQGKNVEVI